MPKAAGILLIFAACAALGFQSARDLENRLKSLRELQRMMGMLKGEIQYAATPLKEAFETLAARMEPPFSVYLQMAAQDMEQRDGQTVAVILEKNAPILRGATGLTKEDIQGLVRAGARLGYLDTQMQIRMIDRYLEELDTEYGHLRAECQEKARVFRTLGVMGGLFAAVLFL